MSKARLCCAGRCGIEASLFEAEDFLQFVADLILFNNYLAKIPDLIILGKFIIPIREVYYGFRFGENSRNRKRVCTHRR